MKGVARGLLVIIFLLEWFALPMQFYLLVSSTDFTFFQAMVRFFSFFTILTNSIVAIAGAILLFGIKSRGYRFFHKSATIIAITVYILIVGIVYSIALRPALHLKGMHSLVSEIFHTIVPVLFLLYWWLTVSKQNIPWSRILYWQIYPLIYVVYTLIHGWYSGFYPYPFIDINKLGFAKAMTNGLFVIAAFVILSFVLIGVGKLRSKEVD